MGSKNSSTKSSVASNNPQKFQAFHRKQANSNHSEVEQERTMTQNSEKFKEEVNFLSQRATDMGRESDIVRIENSSMYTSLAGDNLKGKHNIEENKNHGPMDYQKRIMNAYIPQAEVCLDMNSQIHQNLAPQTNASPHPAQVEMIKASTPLNRISEEIVQSKETVSSKSNKKEKALNKEETPKKNMEIMESYNDFVQFEESERPKNTNRSPMAEKSLTHRSDAKRAKTFREKTNDKDLEMKKKLRKKKKLEKKLK